jgi:peroxiredoxin
MIAARTGEIVPGSRLPHFARESTRGLIDTEALSGRPVVLLFLPLLSELGCRSYLQDFPSDQAEYQRLEAEIVVISTGSPESGTDLPFPVIAGAGDLFHQFHFIHDEGPWWGVVIADRYGILDRVFSEPSCGQLPSESRVAQLLQSAESSCPECGVPEQHWVDAVG